MVDDGCQSITQRRSAFADDHHHPPTAITLDRRALMRYGAAGLNGGLVGIVDVSDQVEPQPTTAAFRPAGEPLAGTVITGFEDVGDGS